MCFVTMFGMVGCSVAPLPPGAIGNPANYNYSASVIENGNTRQLWWCSRGTNPNDSSQVTDAIYYASMDLSTQVTTPPSSSWPKLLERGILLSLAIQKS